MDSRIIQETDIVVKIQLGNMDNVTKTCAFSIEFLSKQKELNRKG